MGSNYTSASLITLDRVHFYQGRFEIRAKIPVLNGSWPSLWFLGTNFPITGWPKCGEIGLLEYWQKIVRQGISDSLDLHISNKEPLIPGWENDFHIYVMEWDDSSIRMFRDGVQRVYFQISNATVGDYNPYHNSFYLLLTFDIGGTSGGNPDNTPFPLNMYVDYVRVYKEV